MTRSRDNYLENRRLPGSIPLSLETWLTMHEDLRNNPSCKVTFDALLKGLQDYVTP